MNDSRFLIMLFISLAVGSAAGFLYFQGLWETIKRLPASKHPAMLALGSFFGRTAFTVAVMILLVRGGRWQNALLFLAGFIIARLILVKRHSLTQENRQGTEEKDA